MQLAQLYADQHRQQETAQSEAACPGQTAHHAAACAVAALPASLLPAQQVHATPQSHPSSQLHAATNTKRGQPVCLSPALEMVALPCRCHPHHSENR